MYRRAILVLIILIFPMVTVSAQTPAVAQPKLGSEPASRFVSTSQLVIVPVVLTDKHGKHVPGLGKQDFEVLENGKPRTLAIFEEVHATGIPPKERTKKTSDDISNFSVDDDRPRRLNIIVMDLVNTPFLMQARARTELISFLSQSLQADQPTALLVIGRDGIKQIHSFTTDTRVLIAALKKVNGTVSPTESTDGLENPALDDPDLATEVGALDQLIAKTDAILSDFQQRDAIRTTMRAMEQIAQAYAGIPGRKTMIWSTAGFPFLLDDPHQVGSLGTDMVPLYERAWRALNDANIAIYPVNSGGLENPAFDSNFAANVQRGSGPMTSRQGAYRRTGMDKYRQRMDALLSFANATGGKPCLTRNDLDGCFKEATQDSQDYYLLGYYLPSDDRKPGWHKLKVRTNRDHVQLRAREGFLVPEAKTQSENDLRTELATALAAPLDYTGIHLDVRWTSVKEQSGKRSATFEISMPSGAFIIDGGNNNHVDLEIIAMAFGPDGKSVTETTRNLIGNLKTDSIEKIRTGGFNYKDEIVVAPGKYKIKFMVRDNQNGKIGTVSTNLIAN